MATEWEYNDWSGEDGGPGSQKMAPGHKRLWLRFTEDVGLDGGSQVKEDGARVTDGGSQVKEDGVLCHRRRGPGS